MKRLAGRWLSWLWHVDHKGTVEPLPDPDAAPVQSSKETEALRIDLEPLRSRPSPALELLLALQQARRKGHPTEGEVEQVAFQVIEAAWRLEGQESPDALVSDLVAEAWGLLAEEALARGAQSRTALALALAEAAAHQGSGDASLAAQQHATWALHFWQAGRLEDARQELADLTRVTAGLDDREAQAETTLWSWLLARHEGRDEDARKALREANRLLAPKSPEEVLARLEARLSRFGLRNPPVELAPKSKPAPGPIANGSPPKPTTNPTLEDTWEEPGPKRKA